MVRALRGVVERSLPCFRCIFWLGTSEFHHELEVQHSRWVIWLLRLIIRRCRCSASVFLTNSQARVILVFRSRARFRKGS